jgi:hypothetical protein
MWEGMEHREIQQAEGSRQRAEDKRQIFSYGSGFPAAILRFERFERLQRFAMRTE